MRVEKNLFRILTLPDKLLVESPLRLDSNGREPKNVLLISPNQASLAGISPVK